MGNQSVSRSIDLTCDTLGVKDTKLFINKLQHQVFYFLLLCLSKYKFTCPTWQIEMTFTSIPILDLAAAQEPATKPQFLKELRHALMEVGFLYLKNVGISDELFQKIIELGKGFFDIPEEEK